MVIPNPILIAIMIMWGILGTTAGFWFLLDGNSALKRKLWPVLNILNGLIIFLICFATNGRLSLLIGAGLLVIIPLTIRYMRFCTRCDRTTYCQHLFKWPTACEYCGSSFKQN